MHHKSQLKEIRIGLDTQEHDLQFKANRVRGFLQEHHKVLISMRLSGREKAYIDQAIAHMSSFSARFEDVGKIERKPTREGAGRVTMLMTPK